MKNFILNFILLCCLVSSLYAQTPLKNEPLVLSITPTTLQNAEKIAIDATFLPMSYLPSILQN